MEGISVIICCHNSSGKIPQVLSHLARQKDTENLSWEIVVVDNASDDDTALVAKFNWKNSSIPLNVVFEPHMGLSYARLAGINNSRYDLLSFIDDDNWVNEYWISSIFRLMKEHPEVGLCGGQGIPVFEKEPPFWFHRYQEAFAVGPQNEAEGYVCYPRSYLYGAGTTLRRSAWNTLMINKFNFILTGRKGKSLSSGEDQELCYALVLYGFKLYYSPEIRFEHQMPSQRLTWKYLVNLFRAFGRSDLVLYIYRIYLMPKTNWKQVFYKYFPTRLAYALFQLAKVFPRYVLSMTKNNEGLITVLYFNRLYYSLLELIKHVGGYRSLVKRVSATAEKGKLFNLGKND